MIYKTIHRFILTGAFSFKTRDQRRRSHNWPSPARTKKEGRWLSKEECCIERAGRNCFFNEGPFHLFTGRTSLDALLKRTLRPNCTAFVSPFVNWWIDRKPWRWRRWRIGMTTFSYPFQWLIDSGRKIFAGLLRHDKNGPAKFYAVIYVFTQL